MARDGEGSMCETIESTSIMELNKSLLTYIESQTQGLPGFEIASLTHEALSLIHI